MRSSDRFYGRAANFLLLSEGWWENGLIVLKKKTFTDSKEIIVRDIRAERKFSNIDLLAGKTFFVDDFHLFKKRGGIKIEGTKFK